MTVSLMIAIHVGKYGYPMDSIDSGHIDSHFFLHHFFHCLFAVVPLLEFHAGGRFG